MTDSATGGLKLQCIAIATFSIVIVQLTNFQRSNDCVHVCNWQRPTIKSTSQHPLFCSVSICTHQHCISTAYVPGPVSHSLPLPLPRGWLVTGNYRPCETAAYKNLHVVMNWAILYSIVSTVVQHGIVVLLLWQRDSKHIAHHQILVGEWQFVKRLNSNAQ